MQSSQNEHESRVRVVSRLPADLCVVLSSKKIFHSVFEYLDPQLAGGGEKPSVLSSSRVAE